LLLLPVLLLPLSLSPLPRLQSVSALWMVGDVCADDAANLAHAKIAPLQIIVLRPTFEEGTSSDPNRDATIDVGISAASLVPQPGSLLLPTRPFISGSSSPSSVSEKTESWLEFQ
jgi:hypothetical protein